MKEVKRKSVDTVFFICEKLWTAAEKIISP